MNRDQVKWLVVGLAGGLFVVLLFAGAAFVAFSRVISLGDAIDAKDQTARGNATSEDFKPVNAPKEWHEAAENWKVNSEKQKPEYERVKALYERVSPYREIRRRLFHEADFEYAEAELPALFAKISDPLAADQYSDTISKLGELSYDTDPEDLRKTMKAWTDAHPDSHYAWLVRGVLAVDYAWYWRGSGWASTVTDEGWENFHNAILEAAQYFEKAYELEPNDPESSAQLIRICWADSRSKKEMEKYFARATKVVPSHWMAYNYRFEYLKPKWDGSWPEYQKALDELEPKTGDKTNPLFDAIYENNRYDMEYERDGKGDDAAQAERDRKWLDIWEGCLERWPDDVRLHGLHLIMLTKAKRYEEAWKEYMWLGNRYPLDIEWDLLRFHHNRMYRLIMHADKLPGDERIKEFDRVVALDPDYAITYHYIGVCHSQRGEYEEAESALLRALELDSSDGGSTHYVLATMYERMGRKDDALRVAQEGKKNNPRDNVAKALNEIENRLKGAAEKAAATPQ